MAILNFPAWAASQVAQKDTQRLVFNNGLGLAANSPYINTLSGGTFPAGYSDEIRSVTHLPAAPGDSLAAPVFHCFTDVCGHSGTEEKVGSITHVIRLETKRGRGPKVCVSQGYAAFKESYTQAAESLKRLITQYINADLRYQLTRLSASKFVCKTGYDFPSLLSGGTETDLGVNFRPMSGVGSLEPDACISFQALQSIVRWLREVALADWFSTSNGAPHFKVIGSADVIEIFRNESGVTNAGLNLVQGQYKLGEQIVYGYSFEGSPAYRGVVFGVDQRPLRFTSLDASGQPIFINPVEIVEDTTNNRAYSRVNPAWLGATYEILHVIAADSFARLTPESYTGEGPFKFAPQLHAGELVWTYLQDNEANVFGDFGFHRYQITRAYRPIRPNHVVSVAYKRPRTPVGLTALNEGTVNTYSGTTTYATLTCQAPS